MLDSNDFLKERLDKKIDLLRSHGELIATRNCMTYDVFLYLYNRYYVELWEIASFRRIVSINLASRKNLCNGYLDFISLRDLDLDEH